MQAKVLSSYDTSEMILIEIITYNNFLNKPTIGIDFTSKNLCINDKNIRLQLWDTAGQ